MTLGLEVYGDGVGLGGSGLYTAFNIHVSYFTFFFLLLPLEAASRFYSPRKKKKKGLV